MIWYIETLKNEIYLGSLIKSKKMQKKQKFRQQERSLNRILRSRYHNKNFNRTNTAISFITKSDI